MVLQEPGPKYSRQSSVNNFRKGINMSNNHKYDHFDQSIMDGLEKKLSDFTELETTSEIFAMLSNPTRLRILFILSETGICCVNHLAETMGIGLSATSHHLRKLRDRRIVKTERNGLNIYYSITDSKEIRNAHRFAGQILGIKND